MDKYDKSAYVGVDMESRDHLEPGIVQQDYSPNHKRNTDI
jgi:hypothetical protein